MGWRVWIAVSLTLAGLSVIALAGAPRARGANRIYWSNYDAGVISYQELAQGGTGDDLVTTGATMDGPMGMALDPALGRVYWANWGAPPGQDTGTTISYANLDGSGGGGTVPIPPGFVQGPHGLAIDPVVGKIYWPNFATNTIGYANLDGTGADFLDTGTATVNGPRGVTIDPTSRRIYWANYGTGFGTTISWASLDGTAGGDLMTTGATVDGPEGVALDRPNNRIYWGNYGVGGTGTTIAYANLNGTGDAHNLDTTGAVTSRVHGVALDPTARRIYWPNYAGSSLFSASLDGGDGQQVELDGNETDFGTVLPTLLYVPLGTGAPEVSGDTTTGSTLDCSQGSWAPDLISALLYRAPQSLTYQWSLNGSDLNGATSSSVQADSPGLYRCRVSANNAAGTASQTSPAVSIETPTPPSTPPTNQFRLGKIKRDPRHGTGTLMITVPGPGEVRLSAPRRLRAIDLNVAYGETALRLRPTRQTAKALRKRGHVRLTATITFTPTGGNPRTATHPVKLVQRVR